MMVKMASAGAAMLGVIGIATGLWQLSDPLGFYWGVPGVADTGPYNPHFVRDIGIAYLLSGTAFLAGLRWPGQRTSLWTLGAAWLALHALFHVWEVAAGICAPAALSRDFAGVSLPALIGVAVAIAGWRRT